MDPLERAKNPGGRDAWSALSKFTPARIALGRSGGSWRTETLLDFRLSHARARDAVMQPFQPDKLEEELQRAGFATFRLGTEAIERQMFLKRPDLGRKLSPVSRQKLLEKSGVWGRRDLVVIVSDGLSALAAERQVVPLAQSLLPMLTAVGWTIFPILVVPFARVKLQDEVGEILHARHALMLLGERPGMGSPDSLGAYFTYAPSLAKTDADRNCISNIRAAGLPPDQAAEKIRQLLIESACRKTSGVTLKEISNPASNGPKLDDAASDPKSN